MTDFVFGRTPMMMRRNTIDDNVLNARSRRFGFQWSMEIMIADHHKQLMLGEDGDNYSVIEDGAGKGYSYTRPKPCCEMEA